jgi:hypothetical protein
VPHRLVARAAALAGAILLLGAATTFADTLQGDADVVAGDAQATKDLGIVAPGATLTAPVGFILKCAGLRHVDAGQTVMLTVSSMGAPEGGSITATDATVGPIPPTWGDDTHGLNGCPNPVPDPISASIPSIATIHAPVADGHYTFSLMYDKGLTPMGVSDGSSISSAFIAASFTLTVVSNTPPTLHLPSDFSPEGNTTGGWTASYPDVWASDSEDNPAPVPSCSPAEGSVLPLGPTTVNCSVVDSGGMPASGSFVVTVVDTTSPVLHGVPDGLSVGTGGGAGAVVTWDSPTATDIVDASVDVGCSPASGSTFPMGQTTVDCTATDDSGNSDKASFVVSVDVFGVQFDEPIGPSKEIDVNLGRVVPVKVQLLRNGVEQASGAARLRLSQCGSSSPVRWVDLSWQADARRWVARLDTTGLSNGCYQGSVVVDGVTAGSFQLHVTGAVSPASAPKSGPVVLKPANGADKPANDADKEPKPDKKVHTH